MSTEAKKIADAPKDYVQIQDHIVEKGNAKILVHNIRNGVNTMLLGATGVGKTELVAALAKELKIPCHIFDMGTMQDPILSLIGSHIIQPNEAGIQTSKFVQSRFSQVIQEPCIVVLDELPRANISANNLLFPCLDFRKELPMEYSFTDSAPVKVHPECVFIATANQGSQYTGTHKLDKALVDRFFSLEIDALNLIGSRFVLENFKNNTLLLPEGSGATPEENQEIVEKNAKTNKNLNSYAIDTILDTYFEINQLHASFQITFNLSIRHLKMIAKMVANGFTIYDAFYSTTKGIAGESALEAVAAIVNPEAISSLEKKKASGDKKATATASSTSSDAEAVSPGVSTGTSF